uniref:histidine kinase n=1 Tax=Phaeocystis antarctica TaxID=33657 RepID=A0A7S0F466_9EUKA|mmetsp:Transcript_36203/g.85439  ORF Transcript_36203/g.85439 Transcript_36203/m.85439 type:complete len:889 (+) Transcript_36203:54-2720(+)
MKLHQLLFGGALLLCVVFISRVLLQQDQLGSSTKRPSASSASLERSIASLVQQQKRVETRLEVLASGLAKLKLPPRSRTLQAEAAMPAVTEAAAPVPAAAAAAEVAQLTERLSAAEATKQEVRFSDMSDISWPDSSFVSDPESMESVLGQGRTSYPTAGQATLIKGARRWSEELTLFQPWRSHTLTGLSKDCISHWKDSNEAEFRDEMYHSAFKWRVFMMSSLAFSVCLMVLVDPCLTVLGVLAFPFMLVLLSTQLPAQRMVDRRRGRQLGQKAIILLCVAFACSCVPLAFLASKGQALTWNKSCCAFDAASASLRRDPLSVLNLFLGPCFLFIGLMVTFMTVNTKCFVMMVTGCLIPACTAYLQLALNLPVVNNVSPVPSALLGAWFMIGCFGGGATIGCMYVVLQRRAAIKTAYELHLAHKKNARITERVEQVEKARGFDRELMMAMTFHEVRNPLNGTVGHLRLAKQLVAGMRGGDVIGGGSESEGGGGALGALEEEIDQSIVATDIAVQYLGTLATLHGALTGSRKLALAPTELTKLIRSAAAVVRPQMQPGVELRVEVPEAKMHVMMDEIMLMQVLLNLMQNAARFTTQGFVCVRCAVEPAAGGGLSANFAVLDSGSGMSDATKATLFDLYSSVGGIGIGMFLSGKLLSLLGSKIEVQSPWRSDGPGAAFYFGIDMESAPALASLLVPSSGRLSLSEDSPDSVTMALVQQPFADGRHVQGPAKVPGAGVPQPGQAAPDDPPKFEANLRVLVADDALMNRRLLRRAFTSYFGQDWSVTEATSAEEAVSLAKETEFALIVMDEIFAPGLEAMRGSAAITHIRAHEERTGTARRAVIVSCTGNVSSPVDPNRSGADLVWGKPMPNFTNNEMQNELAPQLAASLARA